MALSLLDTREKTIKVPSVVVESYDALYDLCENRSKNGKVNAIDVAEMLGVSYESLRNMIFTGAVPFAFGTNKMMGRGVSVIHTLPLFQFMTQGTVFNPMRDREFVAKIIGE